MHRAFLLVLLAAGVAAAQNLAEPQYQLTGKDYSSEAAAIQQMLYNVAGAMKQSNTNVTNVANVTNVLAGLNGTNGVNGINGVAGVNSSISTQTVMFAGTIVAYGGETVPTGWLECNGAAQAQSAYPTLYARIGCSWGCSGSNFNLPDLRGVFLRGWNHGISTATYTGDYDAVSRSTIATGGNSGDNVGTYQQDGYNRPLDEELYLGQTGAGPFAITTGQAGSKINPRMGNETRPKNASVMYIIKTADSAGLAGSSSPTPTTGSTVAVTAPITGNGSTGNPLGLNNSVTVQGIVTLSSLGYVAPADFGPSTATLSVSTASLQTQLNTESTAIAASTTTLASQLTSVAASTTSIYSALNSTASALTVETVTRASLATSVASATTTLHTENVLTSRIDLSTITTAIGLKVTKAGDTMTGALTVTGTSVTANAFFGDGSHLTGLVSSGAVSGAYLPLAGGTMTGPINVNNTVLTFPMASYTAISGSNGQIAMGENNGSANYPYDIEMFASNEIAMMVGGQDFSVWTTDNGSLPRKYETFWTGAAAGGGSGIARINGGGSGANLDVRGSLGVILDSGNVGIGTTTAHYPLDVYSASSYTMRVSSGIIISSVGIQWPDGSISTSAFSGPNGGGGTGITALTGGVTASGTGSVTATVVTNANLTGPVTSVGNATTIVGPVPQAAVNLSTVTTALSVKASSGTNADIFAFNGVGNSVTFSTSVIVTSTLTVQGNAFSVGGSTFSVSGGTVSIGSVFTAQSGGNVGIGYTSPSVLLDIRGASAAGTYFKVGSGKNAGDIIGTFAIGGSRQYFSIDSLAGSGSAQNLILNPSGGNVGIGTTNPAALLDINGAGQEEGIFSPYGITANSQTTFNILGSSFAASGSNGTTINITATNGSGSNGTGGSLSIVAGNGGIGPASGVYYDQGGSISLTAGIDGNSHGGASICGNSGTYGCFPTINLNSEVVISSSPSSLLSGAPTYSVYANAGNFTIGVNSNVKTSGNMTVASTVDPTSAISVYGVITSSTPIPSVTCTAGSPTMTAGSVSEFGSYAAGTLATGCTVTFGTAFPNAHVFCQCQASANLAVWASATSATAVTCTSATAMTGDTITYRCNGGAK